LPNGVENNGQLAAGGQAQNLAHEILLRVVDDVAAAMRERELRLRFGRDGTDHRRTKSGGPLAQNQPVPPAAACTRIVSPASTG